jgi:hypothetical protein
MNIEPEPRVGTWDGKMYVPFIHGNKTNKFNQKMNVIKVNLETNMGMNINIHLHYG